MNNSLFYAVVTSVYPDIVYETSGNTKLVKRDAYTVDIRPTLSFRAFTVNVPVLRINAGGRGNSGSSFMPEEGDLVVCSYIEGSNSFPICLGSITSPTSQTLFSDGNKRHDISFKHKKGHLIQIRDDEINIKHSSGSTVQIDSSGAINIKSGEVNLGNEASEKLLKGDAFKTFYTDIIKMFADTHTHPHIFGPTSPATTPLDPFVDDLLSKVTKTE